MSDDAVAARVLVVADHRDRGRFLGRLLDDGGLDAAVCRPDEVAVELASADPPFAAVLGDDIDADAIGRVRNLADRERAATPVVVLGASGAGDHSDELLAAGASTWLGRPIDDRALLDAVRDAASSNHQPE